MIFKPTRVKFSSSAMHQWIVWCPNQMEEESWIGNLTSSCIQPTPRWNLLHNQEARRKWRNQKKEPNQNEPFCPRLENADPARILFAFQAKLEVSYMYLLLESNKKWICLGNLKWLVGQKARQPEISAFIYLLRASWQEFCLFFDRTWWRTTLVLPASAFCKPSTKSITTTKKTFPLTGI